MQWWIDEPVLLGSHNPTTQELEALYRAGCRTIISLLDETEQGPHYDPGAVQALGYQRYTIPIRDYQTPTLDQIRHFLLLVEQAALRGQVIVHCQAGLGRTGTMGAAYWIVRGLSVEQAITRVRQGNPGAVVTTEQERSLAAWAAAMGGSEAE
jgi:atypical dual specificity phosphatase